MLDPTLDLPDGRRGDSLFIEHTLACAEAALAFHEAARRNPGHELSEWAADWQVARLLGSSRVIPDALLRYSTRRWEFDAFLEVDLGSERPRRFAGKVAAYLELYRSGAWRQRLRAWPLVLVIVGNPARAGALRRTTEQVIRRQRDASRLTRLEFDFAAFEALRQRGPLAAIWQVTGREGPHGLVPEEAPELSEVVEGPMRDGVAPGA